MAEYKGRRTRKRAKGGSVPEEGGEHPPHGHMLILIGVGPKKPKKKAGGHVEGAAARKHLGKRARGGPPRRADGGMAMDNPDSPSGDRDLGGGMGIMEGTFRPYPKMREAPPPEDEKVPVRKAARGGRTKRADGGPANDGPDNNLRSDPGVGGYERRQTIATDQYGNETRQNSGPITPMRMKTISREDFDKDSRGGKVRAKRAHGGRALDAREDANDPDQDGPDKVSQRTGTEERAVEMRMAGGPTGMARGGLDSRASGGRLTTAERRKMPSSEFALPGHGSGPKGKGAGSYPIPDEAHGRNALARVAQHGSPSEQKRVRAAVHRKFPDIGRE